MPDGGPTSRELQALRHFARGHASFDGDRRAQSVARDSGPATAALDAAGSCWPAELPPLVRLAALAHGIEDDLDAHFAAAPQRFSSGPLPHELPEGARYEPSLLLAVLVLTARAAPEVVLTPLSGGPTVLLDALDDPDGRSVLGAAVRWEHLLGDVMPPDSLLASWVRLRPFERLDPSEYANQLDVRDRLQRLHGLLGHRGQAAWWEHIAPADDEFRDQTIRIDVPWVPRDPGAWWRYRAPRGADVAPVEQALDPSHFATGIGLGPALSTTVEAWRLAERPGGARALTDQELGRLLPFFTRQASSDRAGSSWSALRDSVLAEQDRRAHPPH